MTIEEIVELVKKQGFRVHELSQLRALIACIVPGPSEEDESRLKIIDEEVKRAGDMSEGDPLLFHYAHVKLYMAMFGTSLKEATEWGRRLKLKI